MSSNTRLNLEDLKVLEQLSIYPSARFGYIGGLGYALYIYFDKEHAAAALDYKGSVPRVVPKVIVQKLIVMEILKKCIAHRSSVFSHTCILNLNGLVRFRQTKEIVVQIAIGTWFKNLDSDWRDM